MNFLEKLHARHAALLAERAALKVEDDAIVDLVEAESRDALSADESTRHKAIIARNAEILTELPAIEADIAERQALADERAALPKGPTFLNPKPAAEAGEARSMTRSQLADSVVRSIEGRDADPTRALEILKRHKNDERPENRAWMQAVVERGTDVYASAWSKYITGRDILMSAEERASMQVGSNAAGGYIIPTFLDPTIILTNAGSSNVMRQLARVETLTVGNVWNGVTSAGVSASWDAELSEVSDDTPNDFGRAQVPLYMMRAFVQASYESFEDIDNLGPDVAMLFADAKDRLEGTAHCTGTGSAQPTGIFTALSAVTTSRIVSTTGAVIGLIDLQATKTGLPVRWRGRSTWLYNPKYGDAVKALGTALSASFSTYITDDNTEKLLGRPSVESDDAPTTQTTTALDAEMVIGDFSNYLIVDKPGSTAIEFVPQLFNTANNLPDGRRGWIMHTREGAASINNAAFRLLVDKTTA